MWLEEDNGTEAQTVGNESEMNILKDDFYDPSVDLLYNTLAAFNVGQLKPLAKWHKLGLTFGIGRKCISTQKVKLDKSPYFIF